MEMFEITVREDVTLISMHDSPADIDTVASVFQKIAEAGINVDMISQTPPNGHHSSLSFTVDGDDFGGILRVCAEMREKNPDLKISVSSGNCKISVYDAQMNEEAGYAAKVLTAAAGVRSDIRMVTTSECDISILVVQADLENTVQAIRSIL
jgi:aspartate kinase